MKIAIGCECVLESADTSAYLSEVESPRASAVSAPPKKIINKPRRSRRLDVQSSRQELVNLELEFKILREKHEFRESLKATTSNCGLDWKLYALSELLMAKMATEENVRLKKRVESRTRRIQRLYRLIHRNMFVTMPTDLEIDLRIVNLDNHAHMYRVLQSCLDSRSQNQVDVIISKCDRHAAVSDANLQMSQWKTFAIGNHSIGVEFQESVAIPFGTAFIQSIINDNPSLNALKVRENYVSLRLALTNLAEVVS